MRCVVEIELEADGRYIAGVPGLPGVIAYGATREQALAKCEALALHVIAERLEQGEMRPESFEMTIDAA